MCGFGACQKHLCSLLWAQMRKGFLTTQHADRLQDSDCGTVPQSECGACVMGSCQGVANFGDCPQQNPWQPGQRQAPVLPNAWQADFNFYDYMDPTQNGKGKLWYNFRYGGLRNDFYGKCPFVELACGLDNDVPCTVLFYKGYNYYIYPSEGICCGYKFPVWRPDSYLVANASLGGVVEINGELADYWRFQYSCDWIRPPVPETKNRLPRLTVQRDIYLRTGTNFPVRMNETLTSAVTDFFNVKVGPDESIFSSLLEDYKCITAATDPNFLQTCKQYNAQGRLGYLGFE